VTPVAQRPLGKEMPVTAKMPVTTDWAGGLRHTPGGGVYRVIITPSQTGISYFGVEATEPPGSGPPLHLHTREVELFIVLAGEITFWLDGMVIKRAAGGTVLVPCGMPHCFKNASDRPARVLTLFTPGGIEGFFTYGEPLANGSAPPDELLLDRIAVLAPLYGIEMLGPSPLP
jgi:quercetin dioxygenase-like cupin family protein